MLPFSSTLWFTFIIVFVLVFITNYVSQTYLKKKKGFKLSWGTILVSAIQSMVITFLIGKLL